GGRLALRREVPLVSSLSPGLLPGLSDVNRFTSTVLISETSVGEPGPYTKRCRLWPPMRFVTCSTKRVVVSQSPGFRSGQVVVLGSAGASRSFHLMLWRHRSSSLGFELSRQ